MSAKLRPADMLVGAGSLLLLVSTFLPWFSLPPVAKLLQAAPGARAVGGGSDSSIDLNVWDLSATRWWVYLAIFLGICLVLSALLSRNPEWSTILGTPLVIVSLVATISLLVRLVDAPRPYSSAQLGFYLALIGALLLLGGTCWGLRDETVPDGFDKAPRPESIAVD